MTIIFQKKKPNLTRKIFGLLAVLFFTSCSDRFENIEKYQRPDRLQGKIYTIINNEESMSIFAQFMVDVGYDKIVDKTGTYAAFVPSDSVMKIYLMDKYGTFEPSEIDAKVKGDIVKYHILQMPWSKEQLQSLNSRGWINLTDVSNNKPTAFKRKTLLREPNKTYKIQRFLSGDDPYDVIVPDNTASTTTRTVYTSAPKYAPIFFDGFMDAKDLTSSDYSFYFNRPYEKGEVYIANAKIKGKELFAENGFVYAIDQVVEPLKNAEELLENGSYSKFLQLIHNNSVFRYNQQATLAQEGASEGAEVEELYNLLYTTFPINIHSELVGNSSATVESHHGLFAPTDEAMDKFHNTYLKSWGNSWNSVPRSIQNLFVNAHMATEAVYEKDLNDGFYNAIGDVVTENDMEIEEVSYGSNSTFIGLKSAIVPKFLSNVAAPLILDPNYNLMFYSFIQTELMFALKDPSTEFSLFIASNQSLAQDSTIMSVEETRRGYTIKGYDHGEDKEVSLTGNEWLDVFRRRIYGQIGVQPILGIAKREFIETLDGRHMIVQNDTIWGGVPSEFGFNSSRDTTVVFSEITDFSTSNGKVYKCDGWLKYSTKNSYEHLRNTKFLTLLNKVGFASTLNQRLTFMDPTERYTIFVPSDAALNSIQVDTFSVEDVKALVSFHIVKGKLLFTDGREPQAAYRTLNNQFLNLNPQPDNLLILDKNNDVYYDKVELSSKTNLIGMHQQNIAEEYYISNAVVHKIDTVIMPY